MLFVNIYLERERKSMSESQDIRKEEEKRLLRVNGLIDDKLEKIAESVGGSKSDVLGIRKEFWDDVTVNFTNTDERMETFTSITQQAKLLAEQERGHKLLSQSLKMMLRLKQSPYFGRIDFTHQGETQPESIYIGLSSLIADDGLTFMIYDWRAPISSMFYDYSPGPAHYRSPEGTENGAITLKRQFVIEGGKLLHMFDTELTIGDAVLQEVLSRQAETNMKSIVSTIQREQNQIIRNDTAKLLIVQGAAGSGKTSAALQRVAYLLYKHRETLQADNILLFSPNSVFSSYVSTVLPELGETNMRQITFENFLSERFVRAMKFESLFEQEEYVLTQKGTPNYELRTEAIRYKASPHFFAAINRYIERLRSAGMLFHDLRFRGRVLISKEEIAEQFYSEAAEQRIGTRLEAVRKWMLLRLDELEKSERKKAWVSSEIELLDNETYQSVFLKLRKKGRFSEESFDDSSSERAMLREYVVRKHFVPLRKRLKNNRFIDFTAIYRRIFSDPSSFFSLEQDRSQLPRQWHELAEMTCERLDLRELYYEDATPLIYLKEAIEGFRDSDSHVRHVIVDEAQDYSPFQFAFLKRIFPRSKMTVLGDTNQAVFLQTAELDGFSGLHSIFEPAETDTMVLHKSYRSTKEIVEFTRDILHEGEHIVPFERQGEAPKIFEIPDESTRILQIAEDIARLQAQGCKTIGVICKTAEESLAAHEMLGKHAQLELITMESSQLHAGTSVVPAYLAKGIEFDAVLIYDASNKRYALENERKLFYTACTRAMHVLHIYSSGELTPFLRKHPALSI